MTEVATAESSEMIEATDWETTIRNSFEKSRVSQDETERHLAEAVLQTENLNKFCWRIAPELAQSFVESQDPTINKLDIRIWTARHPGHMSVIAVDKDAKTAYLVDAAGLLNTDRPDDSSLGITKFQPDSAHHLYANPDIPQHISPPLTKDIPGLGTPLSEEELGSQPFTSFSEIF